MGLAGEVLCDPAKMLELLLPDAHTSPSLGTSKAVLLTESSTVLNFRLRKRFGRGDRVDGYGKSDQILVEEVVSAHGRWAPQLKLPAALYE